MAILSFDITQARTLVDHAKSSPEHRPTFSQQFEQELWKEGVGPLSDEQIFQSKGEHMDPSKIPAGLWLVKDQGVYLMSNGNPGLKNEDGKGYKVCYAEGMNPKADEGWYEAACSAVGGDDFAEFIPAAWVEMTEKAGKKSLRIQFTQDSMALVI